MVVGGGGGGNREKRKDLRVLFGSVGPRPLSIQLGDTLSPLQVTPKSFGEETLKERHRGKQSNLVHKVADSVFMSR